MSKSIFSENLIKARKLKGWSQEETAAKLFRSREAYAKWENGRNEPSQETLILICIELEIDDLMQFLNNPEYLQEKKVA
jgi:transcriptional regulator with XRE-family HTH domain